jgi:hypothetical protein
MIRLLNNFMALQLVAVVRIFAGNEAALRAWDRYKL